MKKAFLLVTILLISVLSTACINNFAVQELNNKAKSYLEKGDYDNAISRLKSSIDLDGTIFETHYNLGIAYTQAEDYENAIETFKNAAKLKPEFADTYYSLAVAQENFAKDIIDGSYKEKQDDKKDEVKKIDEDDGEYKPYKMASDEKAKVIQLYNDSVQSYNNYLSKASDAKDKQEVEEKIKSLQTDIEKYSALKD